MPTAAELIHAQRDFEIPRGLNTYNTHWLSLMRMYEELGEATDAEIAGDNRHLATEVVDVVIFAHSLLGRLCEELGWNPEDIDQLIEAKMAHNHAKYDEDFFNTLKTPDAIRAARHWHNLQLNEERWGNDIY